MLPVGSGGWRTPLSPHADQGAKGCHGGGAPGTPRFQGSAPWNYGDLRSPGWRPPPPYLAAAPRATPQRPSHPLAPHARVRSQGGANRERNGGGVHTVAVSLGPGRHSYTRTPW